MDKLKALVGLGIIATFLVSIGWGYHDQKKDWESKWFDKNFQFASLVTESLRDPYEYEPAAKVLKEIYAGDDPQLRATIFMCALAQARIKLEQTPTSPEEIKK
jgi:hypothetical protein